MSDDDRRASRWAAAIETLGAPFRLEPCDERAFAPWLPLALGRAPERTVVCARGAVSGVPAQIFEGATTLTGPAGEPMVVESLVLVLEHPEAIGTVSIEFDPMTALGGATPRDLEVGEPKFDRRYRVHAASELAAQASIPKALARAIVARRFRGTLEIRNAAIVACLAEVRLSPPAARRVLRLAQAIVSALHRERGGPYRASGRERG